MKKSLISTVIATVLSTGAAQAQDSLHPQPLPNARHKQAVGLGVGSLAGALVAGPLGLVAGGIAGAMIGWNEGMESDIDQSQQALENTQAELAALESRNNLLVAQAGKAVPLGTGSHPDPMAEFGKAMTADFSLDLYFRSGSAQIEPYYEKRLGGIASLLEAFPRLNVELAGYADRHGSDQDNIQLSSERIAVVKAALAAAGIDPQRIQGHALGERRPVSKAGDSQAYGFDRRVQLRMSFSPAKSTAPVALKQSSTAAPL